MYLIEVFKEADASSHGFIEIDFLQGLISGGPASPSLQRAIQLYCEVLPDLLRKQKVPIESFRSLTARYAAGQTLVTIEDDRGRKYLDDYVGVPLRHKPIVGPSGRIRRTKRTL